VDKPPPPDALLQGRRWLSSRTARLKPQQLMLLNRILELGTMHRAAEALHMSQPAATKLLQDLEDALQSPLFTRHARGMEPTAAGLRAGQHAKFVLAELERMAQDVAGLREGISGSVRIGAVMAAVPKLIVEALAHLAARYPSMQITLLTDTSDTLLRGLRAGEMDVMVGRIVGAEEVDRLRYEPLAEERLIVVAACDHPLRDVPSLTMEDLAHESWVLPVPGAPARRAIESAFHALGMRVPSHPVQAASMIATATLMQHSRMIGVVPDSIYRYFSELGVLAQLPVHLPAGIEPYGLVTMADRPLSAAAETVMSVLRQMARSDDAAPSDHDS